MVTVSATTRRWLLLSLLVALLAGCAPDTGHVHRVAPSSVPFGLMSISRSSGASDVPRGPTTRVYLLHGGRLKAAVRRIVGANVPAEAMRSLLAGPTESESAAGLDTAIPPETHLLSLDVSTGIATVDLSTEFGALGGDNQTDAVAQIVYTITASPYIDAVRFDINGRPIEVPDGTGSLSATPKRRDDYPALRPR